MAGIKTNEDMINALFTLGPTTSVYVIEAFVAGYIKGSKEG